MRTIAIVTAGVLALAMTASGATAPWDSLSIGTPEGPSAADPVNICMAPPTTEALLSDTLNAIPATCDNGNWVRDGVSMTMGFSNVPYIQEQWTGHFESWLEFDGTELGFRCTMDNGALVACAVVTAIIWPDIGQEFNHYCLAYESETGLELPVELDHDWGCGVGGEISPA